MDESKRMSDKEYAEHQQKLREEAYVSEMGRLKKKQKSNKKKIAFLIASFIVFAILSAGAFYLFSVKKTSFFTAEKTLSTKQETGIIDTVFVEKATAALSNYYSVQVGAYKSSSMPDFLKDDNLYFPIVQYEYKGLNCVAFGMFKSTDEAEKAKIFLKSVGFTQSFIIIVENNQRVGSVDANGKEIRD